MSNFKDYIFVECQIHTEIASGYQIIFNENVIYLPKSEATADGNGVYVRQNFYNEIFAKFI